MSDPGIPEGFSAHEAEDLRLGVWRFYRVNDPDPKTSVREDNWVTRDGVAKPGLAGLRDYLADVDPLSDPDRIAPELLARQAGYFLIRGESRQSCLFDVASEPQPPSASVEDGRFVLRATYQRDSYRQPVELVQDGEGEVDVRWGSIVT